MEVLNSSDPELQVKNAEPETKNKSKKLLNELRGFGLKIKKKNKKNKIETKYSTFYSNSKAETSIHDTDMNQSKVQL